MDPFLGLFVAAVFGTLIPLKAKNPQGVFPYATVIIIFLNLLVYALTSNSLLSVRDDAVRDLAVSYSTLSPWRLITSMFLHESPEHILGNMLFLWVFGASAEGRLGPWKFLTIYFATGIIAALIFLFIFGVHEPSSMSFGASGAIMGILGAYIYMFPFSRVLVFRWMMVIRFGFADWQAYWVIGYFVILNTVYGYFLRAQDGTAYAVHLAGFAFGYLFSVLFRPKSDTAQFSEVKATFSEMQQDWDLMSTRELKVLLKHPTDDPELVMIYCNRVLNEAEPNALQNALGMFKSHRNLLLERADPRIAAKFILRIAPQDLNLPPIMLLRLGTRLEQALDTDTACLIYRRVYDLDPAGRDAETALSRLGRLLDQVYHNPTASLETYKEALRLFPNGSLALDVEKQIQRLAAVVGKLRANQLPSQNLPKSTSKEPQGTESDDPNANLGIEPPAGPYMGSGRTIEF